MTPDAIRTCPSCLARVLPLDDGLCPACRRFNFNSTPADDVVVQAARDAAEDAAEARHHEAAVLYWKLFASIGTIVGLMALVFVASFSGYDWFDRQDGDDREIAIVSFVILAATAYAHVTGRRLSKLLKLHRDDEKGPRLFLFVLRDTADYFKDHNLPRGFFGPKVVALESSDRLEDEER